ncbi:MAG: hypothetical protein ACOCT9_02195 [archaeon]
MKTNALILTERKRKLESRINKLEQVIYYLDEKKVLQNCSIPKKEAEQLKNLDTDFLKNIQKEYKDELEEINRKLEKIEINLEPKSWEGTDDNIIEEI